MDFTQTGIPGSLQFAFQEYDLEQLNLNDHAFTIIERTLAYGNREEVRWLFTHYGAKHLANWLRQGGWRTLPQRRLNLWAIYFDISPLPQRSGAWPY